MNTNRKTAIIVGVLYLVSYMGVFAGSALVGPFLEPGYPLAEVYSHNVQLVAGVLLELVNGLAVLGIGVLMFPLLRKHSEVMALGYLSLRVLECAMQIASDFSPLSLLGLSQQSMSGASVASLQASSAGLLADRLTAAGLLGVFFCLGGLVFYYALYQSQLVPRFISVWGFVATLGVAVVIAADLLHSSFSLAPVFALPIILNELFLAIWLIVKGFNPSAVTATPTYAEALSPAQSG